MKRIFLYGISAVFLCLLFLCANNGSAQIANTALDGNVTDISGAIVPGATITIGLNRYAVLGRFSRLWPSVVPDQAFLFALLPA